MDGLQLLHFVWFNGRERGGEKREGKIELSLVWLKEVKGRKANGMIFPPNPLFYFLQK